MLMQQYYNGKMFSYILNYLISVEPLGFFLFFTSLYLWIPSLLQTVFNNNEKQLSFSSKIEWTNRIVATISSITSFTLSCYCIYNKDSWVINEMTSTCALSDFILKFISFYFLFDALHLIVYYKQLFDWSIIIHHLVIGILSYVFIGLYYRKTHLTLLYFLLFEITNPFIHMRWFLTDLKLQNHILYSINGFLMAFCFIFIRDIYVPFKVVKIYINGYNELNSIANTIIFFCFPAITILNLYWTYLVIKGIVKHLVRSRTTTKTTTQINKNLNKIKS
ncbi:hypothetical protein ACTFIV_002029 [Dictyostelium citrinum]